MHQVGLPYHWGGSGLSTGDSANDLFTLALDPNVHIQEVKAATCDIRPGRRPRGPAHWSTCVERYRRARDVTACPVANERRVGFFTDTTLCIGCKACEVACKEWNDVPDDGSTSSAMSYDNTGAARRAAPGGTSRSSSSESRRQPTVVARPGSAG